MFRIVNVLLFALICFAAATAPASPVRGVALLEAQTGPDKLPEAAGKPELVRICTSCHGTDVITEPPRTTAGWVDTVYAMKDFGATMTEAEMKTVTDYLVTHLALLEVNKAEAAHFQLVFGVTEMVAADLVAYRDKQGGFKTIDDLKKAPGLDAAKIDALKERLLFR